jgi:hypothetical protein
VGLVAREGAARLSLRPANHTSLATPR